MIVHELSFPVVWENGVQVGYGGNQGRSSRVLQRTADRASATDVNLAAYHASRTAGNRSLYSGDMEQSFRLEYLRVMKEVYRYMTPGLMRFPIVERSVQKFLQFVGEHGGTFRMHMVFHRCGCEKRMIFPKETITKGNPMAFLVPRYRASEMRENDQYWVIITGRIEGAGGEQVIVPNHGGREIHQAEVLLENHRGNISRMVWFSY